MTKEENREFIKKTESLVSPQDVTAISFLGDFNKHLPKKVQDSMMKKGSEKIPYMGFIVDPYCFFLSYEITDSAKAQAMLPKDYELAATTLFAGDEKKPLAILCAFSARTSAFAGMRLECYLTARNRKTGLMSWIIVDYVTNTNSHDPKNGFCGYSCDKAVYTTTPYGELIVDLSSRDDKKAFSISVNLKNSVTKPLDEELWVEGNMSVDYGGELLEESSTPFCLIFDPVLMKEAKRIPLVEVSISENTFLKEIINVDSPKSAAYFPYGQHFIIKQNMEQQEVTQESDLIYQIKSFLSLKKFKTMKGNDIKKPLFRGMALSSIVNLAIIIFLLFKLLSRS